MRACLPINDDRGLESRIYPHFGAAPMFLIVDTATKEARAIENPQREHAPERCLPLDLLLEEKIDVVVVGAIGAGALEKLSEAGVAAYHATHGTAGEMLDAVVGGALFPVLAEDTCGARSGPHNLEPCQDVLAPESLRR